MLVYYFNLNLVINEQKYPCLGYQFFINRLSKRAAWNVYNLFKIKQIFHWFVQLQNSGLENEEASKNAARQCFGRTALFFDWVGYCREKPEEQGQELT